MVSSKDQLGEDFVSFLLDFIEDPPDDEDAEQLPDLFVKVLLAYSLHFQGDLLNPILLFLVYIFNYIYCHQIRLNIVTASNDFCASCTKRT